MQSVPEHRGLVLSALGWKWPCIRLSARRYSSATQPALLSHLCDNSVLCHHQLALPTQWMLRPICPFHPDPQKSLYKHYFWNTEIDSFCCHRLGSSFHHTQPSKPCSLPLLPLSSQAGGRQHPRRKWGHTYQSKLVKIQNFKRSPGRMGFR